MVGISCTVIYEPLQSLHVSSKVCIKLFLLPENALTSIWRA